jgi:hypothetical protein
VVEIAKRGVRMGWTKGGDGTDWSEPEPESEEEGDVNLSKWESQDLVEEMQDSVVSV